MQRGQSLFLKRGPSPFSLAGIAAPIALALSLGTPACAVSSASGEEQPATTGSETPATALAASAPASTADHPEVEETDSRLETPAAREHATRRVSWREPEVHDALVRIKLLGINDFHGQLSAGRRVGERPVGSAAVLGAYLERAAAAARDGAIIVHAGDHVGASPPVSALLQDEPSIAFLNLLANRHCRYANLARGPADASHRQPRCNVVGTLGNHEFDEGVSELMRLLDGGRHEDGAFLERRWRGARFPYVSANVIDRRGGGPILPPYSIREVGGVRIGFIGAVLHEAATVVTPSGVAGVEFLDEAEAINRYAAQLADVYGVKAIVVTMHQGTRQSTYGTPGEGGRAPLHGVIVDIVGRLHDEIDVVVSGHAHGYTNALIANRGNRPVLVTQAFSGGTAYGDIDLAISRSSGEVVEKSAVIVTTWADEGPGLAPDACIASLVAAAERSVERRVAQVVGVAALDILRAENRAGESALGNLIADAQRARTGVQFAFMNSSGVRADIHAGDVTWGRVFTVQPFGNDLVSMDLSGAQIRTLLEQQWHGKRKGRMLQVSGLSYTWDAAAPVGSRVVEIRDGSGNPLDAAASYRVTVNSFLASGGDDFPLLEQGTQRVTGPVDVDTMIEHLATLPQPFSAVVEGRIARRN